MADERRRKSLSRKSKKNKISRPEDDEEQQNCVICLDKVSCRGKLGVCQHWFCFSCIFEWSKNTNTCPVCKMKFRCISKTHLVQGKSPLQKVRVKDVDQRVYQDDDDFIWAELESSQSEDEISDYQPSIQDDEEDKTFHATPSKIDSDDSEFMVIDSDDSNESEHFTSMSADSDSDAHCDGITFIEDMSCSEFWASFESETDCSPIFQKKSARTTTISDAEDSSDAETDNNWQLKGTNKKSQGKSSAKNGFHRNRQKPQRSSNRNFEAEIQRRKRTSHSRTKTKEKKSTSRKNNNQDNNSAAREECSSGRIGQWLRTASVCSQSSCSQPASSTRSRDTQSQDLSRQRRTRIMNSSRDDESSAEREEVRSLTYRSRNRRVNQTSPTSNKGRASTRTNKHRDVETSVNMEIPYESTRNESISTRNESSSTRNKSRSTRNESSSTRNESSSTRNESSSTRNESSFTRNESRSTRNESRSTRNNSRSQQSVLPKKSSHKKLTFRFESDYESCSSGESWTAVEESSRMPEVSESSRQTTSTKGSKNRQRDKRPSQVLKEMQNFFDE